MTLSAFGETLIAPVTPLAGWKFSYNVNADMVTSTTVGSGTVTSANGMAVLSTGAATGSSAKIETNLPLRYIPGIGAIARFTAIFTTGVAGSSQLLGVGDDADGFFFGFNGATFGVMRRANSTDYWIAQNDWSGEYGDFNYLTGDFDYTKGNVFQIQFQWLGYGAIKFFIEHSKTCNLENCHTIRYANTATATSVLNPTFPIMAMVENTTNDTDIVLKTPSAMAGAEGFVTNPAPPNPFSLEREVINSKTSVSTETNIFTLSNQSTWQSITNRIYAQPRLLSVAVDGTKNAIIRITKNATLGGVPSYTDYNANTSPVQYDTAGTTVTGGTVVFATTMGKADSQLIDLDKIGFEIMPGDTYTFSVESTANTDVDMAILWSELH